MEKLPENVFVTSGIVPWRLERLATVSGHRCGLCWEQVATTYQMYVGCYHYQERSDVFFSLNCDKCQKPLTFDCLSALYQAAEDCNMKFFLEKYISTHYAYVESQKVYRYCMMCHKKYLAITLDKTTCPYCPRI